MHKTKTARDLVYEENKDAIRSLVRFEANRYYKHRSNALLDKMTKRFKELEAEGQLYRLVPPPTKEFNDSIEADAEDILALPAGD